MKLSKFYRVRTWYKNMAMAGIGILSAPVFEPIAAFVGFLQVFLIQLHSFSMNDYYDHKMWGEDTYVGKLVEEGWSMRTLLFLMLAPLAVALLLFPVSKWATLTLVLYSGLFYLYQGPPRLKNHWVFSLLLNGIPLGWVVYAHPFLVLHPQVTPIFIFFSVIFTSYIMFFEVAHQIEHQDEEEDVYSVLDAFGVEKSVLIGGALQMVPAIVGITLFVFGQLNFILVIPTLLFSLFRLYRLFDMMSELGELKSIRRSWHKFYTAFEGAFYAVILVLLDSNYGITQAIELISVIL